jgi:hypothetical protein
MEKESGALHANTLCRKFGTNIPRKMKLRSLVPSQFPSQFPHSCICERFIYFHDRSGGLIVVIYKLLTDT